MIENFRIQTLLVVLTVLSAGCADLKGPTATVTEDAPPQSLRTAADSAKANAWRAVRGQPRKSISAAQATIALLAGDQVDIRLENAECARQGNVIAVSGTLSGTLTSNACYDVGAALSLGPAPEAGPLNFEGSGTFLVEGTHPSFVVRFEDGADSDYNDAVLSVNIIAGEPKLSCAASERGQPVTCTVTPLSIPVQGWKFRGGRATVTAAGGSNTWHGPAVVGGEVEAQITYQGELKTLKTSFGVQDRAWQWGRSDFSYQDGAAAMVGGGEIVPSIEVDWLAGWNCTMPDCTRGWILPDLAKGETGGYTIEEVATGPNQGFFFIRSANFRIERGSNYNPHIQPGAASTFPLLAAQASACPAIPTLPDGSVEANWYNFNKTCKGVDTDAWLAAVRAHEGYGTLGTNGHQSQGENAALQPRNDPKRLIENLFTRNRQDLDNRVVREVTRAESRIARDGGREPTTNHPPLNMWLWSYNKNRYTSYRMGSI